MWLHLPAPSRQPLCASLSIWQRGSSVHDRESALRRLREISRPELVQLRLVHWRQLHDLERGAAAVLKDLELGLVMKNPLVLDSAEHLRARPSPFEVLGARSGKKQQTNLFTFGSALRDHRSHETTVPVYVSEGAAVVVATSAARTRTRVCMWWICLA
eukprot:CAMPEP_0185350818 /NCGR_PEP_ID=MMETSP1364-20130426/3073_1 /TAXON_ID=38817 /ORGANISM="Gephyrocapsa oceanica, Strain RCC1303" /LENGTH=157 /DNA_ID=CAMNT_0027950343 /DNA_START=68 /DNA_END=538 /DNA_ORIENTATION=-